MHEALRRVAALALLGALVSPTPTAGGFSGGLLPLPIGNWIVRTPLVLADLDLTLRGDLIIEPGGSLRLWGVTLRMEGARDGDRRILVRSGGALATAVSPVTGRRGLISQGEGRGRYAFDVESGAMLQLSGTTVRDAGWNEERPGLVVGGTPASGAAIVDCDFEDNFVGLTLRDFSGEVAASRFHGNRSAGITVEDSNAELRWIEISNESAGARIGPRSSVTFDAPIVFENEIGITSQDSNVQFRSGLLLHNRHHVWIQSGQAIIEDNLFVAAEEVAVLVEGGASSRIRFNDFVLDVWGVRNENTARSPVVDARENFWGSPSGPGGAGGGNGDPVTDGVEFDPWCVEGCRRPLLR